MVAGLGEDLKRDIIRYHIPFDQSTEKFIFGLGRGREADLNFLESDLYQKPEEPELRFQIHRHDERLVSVTKIH